MIVFWFLIPIAGLFAFTRWMSWRISNAHPPQGQFVTLRGGGRIHLVQLSARGPERGTVVLLHGASGNHADVVRPLGTGLAAAGFRVIAPDRPGHGWSERISGSAAASPARQAEILVSALRQIGIREAIVVGHSWSGALAANIALAYPRFTRGLVLLSPVTHVWPGGISWYYHVAAAPYLGWLFTNLLALPAGLLTLRPAIAGVFSPKTPEPDFAEATGVAMVLRPQQFAANAEDVSGLYEFVKAQAPGLGKIAAPTAIVAGDSDTVVYTSIHSVQSARDIPGATLEILPGMGHSPHHCAPDAVIGAIIGVARRAGL